MRQTPLLFSLITLITLAVCIVSCSKEKSPVTNNRPPAASPGTYLLFDEDPLFNSGQSSSPSAYTSLYYSKLDGSGLTRLTTPPSGYFDYRASFSGDGKHVVFIRDNALGSDCGLYVINTDGDSLRNITKFPNVDFGSLSPNSTQVAFAESVTAISNPEYQIIISNLYGDAQTPITSYSDIGSATYIHWASNNVLYFSAGSGGGHLGIYSCNPDGSGVQMVLSGAGIMSVSNDAKYLLYYESGGLYYCAINGQNSKLIMSFDNGTIGNPAGATMTDDDKQVYFYYSPTATPSQQGIYKVNIDGSGLTQVLSGYYEIPSIF